jgi:hypothetical protein
MTQYYFDRRQAEADRATLEDAGLSCGEPLIWYKGGDKSEPLPAPDDGVRFFRGLMFAGAASLPFWIALFYWLDHC